MERFVAFAAPSLSPLGALLVFAVASGVLGGLGLAAAVYVAWTAFRRVYRAATGIGFVFTKKMALALSWILAVLLAGFLAWRVYLAIAEGSIIAHPHHGAPQVYYWFEDRSGFVWAICEVALNILALWALVTGALFGAAAFTKGDPSPTPPTQTAPPRTPPAA